MYVTWLELISFYRYIIHVCTSTTCACSTCICTDCSQLAVCRWQCHIIDNNKLSTFVIAWHCMSLQDLVWIDTMSYNGLSFMVSRLSAFFIFTLLCLEPLRIHNDHNTIRATQRGSLPSLSMHESIPSPKTEPQVWTSCARDVEYGMEVPAAEGGTVQVL